MTACSTAIALLPEYVAFVTRFSGQQRQVFPAAAAAFGQMIRYLVCNSRHLQSGALMPGLPAGLLSLAFPEAAGAGYQVRRWGK